MTENEADTVTVPPMPHPDAMGAGFVFARTLRDPEFRAFVTGLGAKGCPVVCTYPGEDPDRLASRVRETLRDDDHDVALTVVLDDTQRWGLRIEVCHG